MSQFSDNEEQGTKCCGENTSTIEADQTHRNPLAVKQALLHLLCTDALVADRLSGEVIRTVSDLDLPYHMQPYSPTWNIVAWNRNRLTSSKHS